MRNDIVRWFVDAVAERGEACLTPDGLRELELCARREWGGQRIDYIAKTISGRATKLAPAEQQQVFRHAIDTTLPSAQIANEAGISRRTLYRLIKRGPQE